MSRRRLTAYLSVGLCAALPFVLTGALAQPLPDETAPPAKKPPVKPTKPMAEPLAPGQNETFQAFPCLPDGGATKERALTAWKVRWATQAGNGLYIVGAWFKKGPKDQWLQVLGDARLAQAFVPYHRGTPRFWDIDYNFALGAVTSADAGPHGQLLRARPQDRQPTIVKEIRDRGIMFKHPNGVRRGQSMALWGVLDAGNYRYLVEYGFQDDGTIEFRVGASGHNLGGGAHWEPHMHNAMWRIDVNLGGADHNSVVLCEHIEPDGDNGEKARTQHTTLKEECGLDWDAKKFTMLRVINTQMKNARGQPVSYDLMPLRSGSARHFGKDKQELCTQHDFWVTRANPKEMSYQKVPEYVKDRQPIEDTDVVLWYSTPCHHEPRSEDGEVKNGSFDGATHVMWCSVQLRPRNVFDRSPFYPPPK
jgi:primary-amine oxidase